MASPRASSPRKSARNYAKNPSSYAKKKAYDRAFNARPEQKRKRAQLGRARNEAKRLGHAVTGRDMSHTRDGRMVLEYSSTNRARNGANGSSTLK